MPLHIRQEQQSDFPAVQALLEAAFGQAGEARLVALLRDSDAFVPELSLVATLHDQIVGHILFSKIIIADDRHNEFESLALAPVAVIPEHQKQGIGGHLIRAGLEKAIALGFQSVIVLGHEHYYPKFGFLPADKWQIKPPFEVPANVFMGLELVPDGLRHVSGTVLYPEAFDQV